MMKRPLPIGVDDYREIIEKEYYYVDKTLLVKELLDKKGKVTLFTRPRRFGKTLNLSMLRYFFEIPMDGETNRDLFAGLNIMSAGEKYTCEQEQYPVINLTLKSAKQGTYQNAYACLKEAIANEYLRHAVVKESLLTDELQQKYYKLMNQTAKEAEYLTSLAFLSQSLYQYYQKKVIILIDEYDVPLENAYYQGFYDEMVTFIRSIFESALKTNPYLEFSVIIGCLRISRESIFTGLNNLKIVSILNDAYGEYFGFEEEEVRSMLRFYEREQKLEVIREWYDGYLFGRTEVYNPWSVIDYISKAYENEDAFPTVAWANTSSNTIIKDMIFRASEAQKAEIETLIQGGTVRKRIHEDITYEDIYESEDNLWNFLFFTGYLKQTGKEMQGDDIYLSFAIPNREIRSIYRDKISSWFRETVKVQDLSLLYSAMLEGKEELFQELLTEQLGRTISYLDDLEAFYHGFLLGILGNLKTYLVKSNREAGDGRYDICVRSHDLKRLPVILELKTVRKYKELEAGADEALRQIMDRKYDAELVEEGYTEAIHYGISFFRKQVKVKSEKRRFCD